MSTISSAGYSTKTPNVIYILVDDLGWGDVSYHGSPIRTPNIDRLARHGIELDNHYVCPVCTPTRTSLMSGMYPGRFGAHATTPSNQVVLPDNQYTLANLFRDAGYDTALFGKWHLGSDPRYGPYAYGFDYSYGSFAGGVDPYNHCYKPGPFVKTWHRNGDLVKEPGHVTDLITDEAIQWMEARKNPFFCYIPYTAVHTPIRPPEEWFDCYAYTQMFDDPEKNEAFQRYAAYVSHMDHAIGRVIEMVKRQDILGHTVVVFASDNGAVTYERNSDHLKYPGYRDDMHPVGCNEPLRGYKSTLYEGGIRTPAILSWRGNIQPNKIEAPMHISDWLPTFADLLEIEIPGNPEFDGVNMWPTINGSENEAPSRSIYWNLRHQRFAIREDGWKLIIRNDNEQVEPVELFKIADDPQEKENVAQQFPEIVTRLKERIMVEHAKDDRLKRDDVN